MAYWVARLMGEAEQNFSLDLLHTLYDELSGADGEHTDVSLTHESEWCLAAFFSGLLVWENVAGEGEPKHMKGISREKVLTLWKLLASGRIDEIDQESWVSGYGQ
ncbi:MULTISPECIES: hypothetical protein [unclassified Halomonas]|uniref:hypothetical protein n=1 Tax=unclassified Halomonas TaxID=2609666 RepID=UPI0007D903BD|nr:MULTISPECIES: hypothetical protein [unclassified Halomonas]MBT2788620.1 hypothetical protein [Halomonas sp. ISL-106]MBT2798211.1 hypothetical protein [Halomonas sp. ISL-104]OAL60761.1 hypothetical protein A6R74_18790 [Halomonas sp. ALS9]